MILITGATGTIGSHLLHQLTSRGETVRAMTRNPGAVRAEPGVDLVRADFDDPASLAAAVADVRAVFLLTAPTAPTPRHDLAMLDTARSAGVTTVVKLSAIGTGETIGDNRTVGAWHLQAEQAVRSSGMAWTVLRPSSFASNVLRFAQTINAGHPIPNMTGTATQGVIDPRDVAAVAAEALTTPGHAGRTYTLTGPELLSVPDQAAILESVLDRPVTTVDLPLDTARDQILQHGTDPEAADAALTGIAWARAGHNAVLTQDVHRILGRPATAFITWVQDHRDAFRPTP
ncbi:NAD(P)-dependent oxidoreductase [Saccharothrix sp. ALI-22-I]|uniref:NAD(P)H-binding protein n=1 Tax=Saccharothrix sp. ALI-22-I TaxID=1933778 RepID=UPI00097BD4C7|nr:NAD(P)H-binding protein [Saccharothrix sp. ALI-22-I]ONI91460.1 NAD(P)-dependent oxidoreductase [Saccharothrix sp. ALI-22-I]